MRTRDGRRNVGVVAAWVVWGLYAVPAVAENAGPPAPAPVGGVEMIDPDLAMRGLKSGHADLRCTIGKNGAFNSCTVLGEDPPGMRLGDAALRFSGALRYRGAEISPGAPYEFRVSYPASEFAEAWRAALGSATIKEPKFLSKPNVYAFLKSYPNQAAQRGVQGLAVLNCTVNAYGNLTACSVVGEAPASLGFGSAAIRISKGFRFAPKDLEGVPTANGTFVTAIRFTLY